MQDRFKFRVWDKKDKELIDNPKIKVNVNGETINAIFSMLSDRYEFLQCTGLKDKNGQLIYEKDIVTYKDMVQPYDVGELMPIDEPYEVIEIDVVIYDKGMFILEDAQIPIVTFIDSLEVIGNVKEDKELLEG